MNFEAPTTGHALSPCAAAAKALDAATGRTLWTFTAPASRLLLGAVGVVTTHKLACMGFREG